MRTLAATLSYSIYCIYTIEFLVNNMYDIISYSTYEYFEFLDNTCRKFFRRVVDFRLRLKTNSLLYEVTPKV